MAHQLPTPLDTASNPSSGPGPATRRSRRDEASSSSESALGTFAISNLDNRVVTPPRPLPLVTYQSDSDDESRRLKTLFGDAFERKAVELTSNIGIPTPAVDASFVARISRDDPADTQPTVLIIVDKWTPESKVPWQGVVEKLKCYIDQQVADLLGTIAVDVSVEMLARDLVRPKYLSLLDKDEEIYPRLVATWPRIQDGIYDILESFSSTSGHMTAISLFKLGFNRDLDNPNTVYVTVDYDSPASGWPPVLQAMRAYADSFDMDLVVHLEHNLMGHHAFNMLKSDLTLAERQTRRRDFNYMLEGRYSKTVNAGDDVGAYCYIQRSDGMLSSPLVGTLGCWIEINIKDRGWKKVGLTCYHVIRPCLKGYTLGVKEVEVDEVDEKLVSRSSMGKPEKDSDLWAADIQGLQTEGNAGRKVEHPTRAKHNFTVEIKRERVQYLESKGYPDSARNVKAGLDEAIAFFDGNSQYLGKVCFASGYMRRTRANGRLDWALISPCSDRIGGNPLPSVDAWQAKQYVDCNLPVELKGNMRPQARSLYDLEGDKTLDKAVFKNGASTTCTKGVFSEVKTECTISEERYMLEADHVPLRIKADLKSKEFAFISPDGLEGTFGDRGDSGAVVWDECGRVMGLLFTGQQPQGSSKGYSLVTPIEDVFQDIRDASGGDILDIRIPTDSGHKDVKMS
ncbi:hypothetical protein B0T25DRAFT_221366 [Lasiosphaeria hispida]|uniref:Uncharacterized protein n=1 Tax=Lasiosphaeria hispida TaxID=260671 RepID=A0AAJ0HJF3_9PEZI|nr:hypothetical protein B0T25DRAFT_221366 [Lasiosphaeria hispida]